MKISPELSRFLTPESFGQGTVIGDKPEIMKLSPEERLILSAWHHACPNRLKVVKVYGIEWTRMRYDDCDFVFKSIICDHAERINPALHRLLTTSVPRNPEEPVGMFEIGAIPDSHFGEMSPLSTLWGYALPRVFIEQAGRDDKRTPERYFLAISILDEALKSSKDPVELLAVFSELVVNADADTGAVLEHVLEPEILKEENCIRMYGAVLTALENKAPTLWSFLLS